MLLHKTQRSSAVQHSNFASCKPLSGMVLLVCTANPHYLDSLQRCAFQACHCCVLAADKVAVKTTSDLASNLWHRLP
jgi:hypothetical protein